MCLLTNRMEKSWDIVFWTSEKSVNYVPSCWAHVDKTAYKWPTGTSRPGQPSPIELIRKCEDIKKNYQYFPAIFKKKVTNLQDAERFTKKAEDGYSDLESALSDAVSTSSRSTNFLLNEHHESSEDEMDNNTWVPPSMPAINAGNSISTINENVNLGSILINTNAVLLQDEQDQPIRYPEVLQTNGINLVTQRTGGEEEAQQSIALSNSEKYLVRIISGLSHEVKELKNTINRLETAILVNHRPSHNASTTAEQLLEIQIIDYLPSKTKEQFQTLETMMESKESFDLLVDILYLVGGDNYKSAIYAALKKLLTSDVALQYSGQGKLRGGQKKDSFSDLLICAALKKAIRKRFPDVTDTEFKDRVGTFLCTAKDRDGGRKKRKLNDSHTEENSNI